MLSTSGKQWSLHIDTCLYAVTAEAKNKAQVLAACNKCKSTVIIAFMLPLPAALHKTVGLYTVKAYVVLFYSFYILHTEKKLSSFTNL